MRPGILLYHTGGRYGAFRALWLHSANANDEALVSAEYEAGSQARLGGSEYYRTASPSWRSGWTDVDHDLQCGEIVEALAFRSGKVNHSSFPKRLPGSARVGVWLIGQLLRQTSEVRWYFLRLVLVEQFTDTLKGWQIIWIDLKCSLE